MDPIRKKKSGEASQEWLMSYADVMTLLMCFFLLILGMSKVNSEKMGMLAESLGTALGARKAGEKEGLGAALGSIFGTEESLEFGEVSTINNKINVRLYADITFNKRGEPKISKKSKKYLDRLIKVLKPKPVLIVINGHSNESIKAKNEIDYWTFAQKRAMAVLEYFLKSGFNHYRLRLQLYAHTEPLEQSMDEWNKPINRNIKKNNRVDLGIEPL